MPDTTTTVCLTGIKPTGEPHLGNYAGAIAPALELADRYQALYFIADQHALTTARDPHLLRRHRRSVAATWIAAGLDPRRTVLYRQSDVPEIAELTWILSCLTGKGLMNRAHAYKAARERNRAAGRTDLDAGISMGLFGYPVLMAADILVMGADVVPVGRDQAQHVEIAADLAGAFNHAYGDRFGLTVPRAVLPPADAGPALPGTDGRKMSKSHHNTIPLCCDAAALRAAVRGIRTDSTPVAEPKDPDGAPVVRLLAQFAPAELTATTRDRLRAGGMGWGEVKELLFGVLNDRLAPLRERYLALMEPDSELDDVLAAGAERARRRAAPILAGVRHAVGLG